MHRDGTDGQATVFWSLKPSGVNQKAVTHDDISPFNGSVVFLSGQSDTTINITVKADDIPEMNETVLLTLDRYPNLYPYVSYAILHLYIKKVHIMN